MPLLGVNIDHVATVRQARREQEPDPIRAAAEAEAGGADGITVHLREDRRHIQDHDMRRLRTEVARLDMEMAPTDEMVAIACDLRPDMATLVPERRQELTTEGGLDARGLGAALGRQIARLKAAGILVSLFIEPEAAQVQASRDAGADFIEIHTGLYCNAPGPQREKELDRIRAAALQAGALGLRVNAGHGLDYTNVAPVAAIPGIVEFNIGHAIMARAVFVGLERAVRDMAALVRVDVAQAAPGALRGSA
jgi:pyridoxine 5-phosphate synthase